jgi:4-hydroxy 2-oxovalerate aldolase
MALKLLDCTLRDGGYYNNWDFSTSLIEEYLVAMDAVGIDYVELGFRSLDDRGFKGACAYTTDNFIRGLSVPVGLQIGVMLNAAELHSYETGAVDAVNKLFSPAKESSVVLVRIACHVHEFLNTLPVCDYLKSLGYQVGINLMQIADCPDEDIENLAFEASKSQVDVLYFADSLGCLTPDRAAHIIKTLRSNWDGEIGIHAHDNMSAALINSVRAGNEGVVWVDSTVTGMGRGPGNTKTENILIEFGGDRFDIRHQAPLLKLIDQHFNPLKTKYGWGTNPYYFLAGKYGIHPTYVQEMLGDPRYDESEMLSVIEHLHHVGGKKFNAKLLETGRNICGQNTDGSWDPADLMNGRDVLVIGPGSSVTEHCNGLEEFIRKKKPLVIALNVKRSIDIDLIDIHAACHPYRMVADCAFYQELKQPLVLPKSQIPEMVKNAISGITSYDFGLCVKSNTFEFNRFSVVTPSMLVISYVLGMVTSGKANQILLAGLDGFDVGDLRFVEMDNILSCYQSTAGSLNIKSITPTRYKIPTTSLYAI